jgi:hypothetical protein
MKSVMQSLSTPVFGAMVLLSVWCSVLPNRLEAQGRVAQTFERKMKWILGAPLFRVLCERVGGSAGLLWLCDDAPERSS